MKIGLTYNLKSYYLIKGFSSEQVSEFDCEETIDAIERALKNGGHETMKIGCLEQLVEKLQNGERWDLVFNIAEGLYGIGREAQIPALLDAYQIPFTFSSTEITTLALDKGITNTIMRSKGIKTANFKVVSTLKDINKIKIPFPLFAKPIAEGTSKGINRFSKIETKEALITQCEYILKTFRQPAIVEEYLPGKEYTVGILGNGADAKAIGVMEIKTKGEADSDAYTYDNKQLYENRIEYNIVDEPAVKKLALRGWKAMNASDCGRVDVRCNAKGEPCFMELNTMAGLNPTYSDLCILCNKVGMKYDDLINGIVESAIKRYDLQ
jgi:D-alanine-D-alanine ligase